MGEWSAASVGVLGLACFIVLAIGMGRHGLNEPITDPILAVVEALTLSCPEDVLTLAAEFRGKVEFAWGTEVIEYGMREFGVRDPSGYDLACTGPA